MTNTTDKLSEAFQRSAYAISQLCNEDVAKLSDENYEIDIRLVRRRQREEPLASADNNAIREMALTLSTLNSREEASVAITSVFDTKRKLEQLAKHLDISILKQDKTETVRDKIIEATVGAKLRSEAIQGK